MKNSPNNASSTTQSIPSTTAARDTTNVHTLSTLTDTEAIINETRRRLTLLAASYLKTIELIMADALANITQEQCDYIASVVEEQGYYLDRSYLKVDPVPEEDRHIYKTIP